MLFYNTENQRGLLMNDKFTNPIDYEQTILAVVKIICDYYKGKIAREARKISKEKYDRLVDAHAQLVAKSAKDCFWANRSWTSWSELLGLSDMHRFAETFFEAAKAYKDAKAAGKDIAKEEKSLADAVKKVDLRAKTHSSIVAELVGGMNIFPGWLFATHTKGQVH